MTINCLILGLLLAVEVIRIKINDHSIVVAVLCLIATAVIVVEFRVAGILTAERGTLLLLLGRSVSVC